MSTNYHLSYFESILEALNRSLYYFNANEALATDVLDDINDQLKKIAKSGNKIFFFGNGASAAFANHMALDFSKNGNILSRSLSDSAMLTALSNDYSYESAMVEFMKIEGITSQDFVITISSSGNSPNIVNVLNYCKENAIPSMALSGLKNDNKSISLARYSIYVPMKTYGMVECAHQIFLHLILDRFMGIEEWNRADYQNMNIKDFKL